MRSTSEPLQVKRSQGGAYDDDHHVRFPAPRRFGRGLLLGGIAMLLAALTPPAAGQGSQTFYCQGSGTQAFQVPAGVTALTATLHGAHGSTASFVAGGGSGGMVQATVPVPPGQTLYVWVGCIDAKNKVTWGFGSGGDHGVAEEVSSKDGGLGGGEGCDHCGPDPAAGGRGRWGRREGIVISVEVAAAATAVSSRKMGKAATGLGAARAAVAAASPPGTLMAAMAPAQARARGEAAGGAAAAMSAAAAAMAAAWARAAAAEGWGPILCRALGNRCVLRGRALSPGVGCLVLSGRPVASPTWTPTASRTWRISARLRIATRP